ncbi:MAG: hypothetical protein DK306_002251 [Chloroflexi bacterium]|nr:MAG: hypothetical protein DK306_002251 [Chloroflexota bacterium]
MELLALTRRYLASNKNIPGILQKIVEGSAPEKFTLSHLKDLGFKSSNDQPFIPILKELGFLTGDGSPTPRYHAYRDASRSQAVLGEALRETYGDLFLINETPTPDQRTAIEGKFKSVHNVKDDLASRMATTFFALLELTELPSGTATPSPPTDLETPEPEESGQEDEERHKGQATLHYNIQIHLPATRDVEVYNAIFKSLRDNVLG